MYRKGVDDISRRPSSDSESYSYNCFYAAVSLERTERHIASMGVAGSPWLSDYLLSGVLFGSFLGDTRDTSAFTFIAIPDSQTSSLDELSSVVAFIAFIVSFLLGLVVIFFVIKRYGSPPPVAVSPTPPLPPSVSANTVPQQPVQPPVLAPVSPAPGEGTTTSGVPAVSPNQPDLPKTE